MIRRDVFATAAAIAATMGTAAAQDNAAELAALTESANVALMKGDAAAYAAAIRHSKDFTMMQPFGGKIVHGFDPSPEHLERLGGFFSNGSFKQEVVQSIISPDVSALVIIERPAVEVGGLPMQEWALRVTLVFRRENGAWHLAHRHADPLVHGISVQTAAALASGGPVKPGS
jgi:ketosteroid isomerase-like protein